MEIAGRLLEIRNISRLSLFLSALLLITLALSMPALVIHAQEDGEFLALAVRLAHKVQRDTGVPASVIVAQAILESAWGRRPIADSNNYFGIKALEKPDGTINIGQIATGWTWSWTKEWDGKQYVDSHERFRAYRSMADSFDDLGRLYSQNERYARAMTQTGDPRQFAREIAAAGYATAPDYADRVIGVMEAHSLYQYDLQPDQAVFMDQSDYPTVLIGKRFNIFFELKNVGLNAWSAKDDFSLRALNETTLGASPRQELSEDIPPDDSVRWSMELTAPLTPGTYRTAWRLYHGDQPFGPEMYIDVTVVATPPPPDYSHIVMALLASALALGGAAGSLFFLRLRFGARRK